MLGWDFAVAFAFAAALGIDARAVAELLPGISNAMADKTNEAIRGPGNG